MAVTNDAGSFTISDVPVGRGYQIVVMKGNYITIWNTVEVSTGAATPLETKQSAPADLVSTSGLVWKGSLAAAPEDTEPNWDYYNTAGSRSYIWDGSAWQIIDVDGTNGADGGSLGAGGHSSFDFLYPKYLDRGG
jgi:hypothetical protein